MYLLSLEPILFWVNILYTINVSATFLLFYYIRKIKTFKYSVLANVIPVRLITPSLNFLDKWVQFFVLHFFFVINYTWYFRLGHQFLQGAGLYILPRNQTHFQLDKKLYFMSFNYCNYITTFKRKTRY